MVELVDTSDLKSDGYAVGVRVPLSAPIIQGCKMLSGKDHRYKEVEPTYVNPTTLVPYKSTLTPGEKAMIVDEIEYARSIGIVPGVRVEVTKPYKMLGIVEALVDDPVYVWSSITSPIRCVKVAYVNSQFNKTSGFTHVAPLDVQIIGSPIDDTKVKIQDALQEAIQLGYTVNKRVTYTTVNDSGQPTIGHAIIHQLVSNPAECIRPNQSKPFVLKLEVTNENFEITTSNRMFIWRNIDNATLVEMGNTV